MSLFESDTTVEAMGDHRFATTITDRWDGLAGRPLGGYVLAVCLRALRAVMPARDLLLASAHFLNPVLPGRAEVHTELVRAGRRTSVGEARLCQDGVEAVRVVATFTELGLGTGQDVIFADPPGLPSPSRAVALHVPPTVSIVDRIEYRVAETRETSGPRGNGPARTELWMRLREGGGDDGLCIPLLVDAAPPAVMEIGATGSMTLQLTVAVHARPGSEWFACRASTRYVTDGYHEEDFEVWDQDGRPLAQSRQLARLPKADRLLVADTTPISR